MSARFSAYYLQATSALLCRCGSENRRLSATMKATPPGGDGAARRPERNGQGSSIAHGRW